MSVSSEPADNATPINFMTWGIWPPTLAKPMGELIRDTLEQFPPEFSLPFIYSGGGDDGRFGSPVKDPMTIYCRLPFGPNLDENPEWSVSLRSIVEDMVFTADVHSEHEALTAMAEELKRLAQFIEGQIAECKAA